MYYGKPDNDLSGGSCQPNNWLPIYKISMKEVPCGGVAPGSQWLIPMFRADFLRIASKSVQI
jgi:hypothetical protein